MQPERVDERPKHAAEGDRVEVRLGPYSYIERGTTVYEGRVAQVNFDATFDVGLDDGNQDARMPERV